MCRAMGTQDDRCVELPRHEWREGRVRLAVDAVVGEEPLEIRIAGVPIAVVMRTPGQDIDLGTGFLLTEGVIDRVEDIASIRHCDIIESPEAEDNVLLVRLRPEIDVNLAHLRRNMFTGSSCGICGKATIVAAMQTTPALSGPLWTIDPALLGELPDRLRDSQELFARTGGSHAAGLFDRDGGLRAVREDVGRHNAVDKLIGWAVRENETLANRVLVVSGRVSYEIVQKALMGGIPMICSVSAASSLAIEYAQKAGLTLVSFVRDQRLCVYAGEGRLAF